MVRKDNAMEVKDLNLWYDDNHALIDVNMRYPRYRVTALIGPSGCGKSTLIRTLNRMNDVIVGCRVEGTIFYNDNDIYKSQMDVIDLRSRVGMIFQKPNPFPKSIFENIAYGPRVHGITSKRELEKIVIRSLKQAYLFDEVKDRLNESALGLSGGQQQRLCIARALAVEPEILLMDEPTSALDPLATTKIEDLIFELKKRYTVIIVTHNMQQAARVSDYTGFMYLGKMIETGMTKQIFEKPKEELTENYITGRFG